MELMLCILMFCCYANAIEYIDLINDTESETFINLTLDDYKLTDDLEDIDVKTVIIAELARNGIELTSDVINFLDHPLQSGHFEGDIELPLDESIGLAEANYSNSAYAAIVKHRKIWTNGTVPYLISSNYGSTARMIIASAIDHFHKHTCIKFVSRSTQTDYLNIRPKLGCGSHIGRMGNAQDVSISAGCVKKTVIIHGLMHALGFFHEQARYDRDQYVEIHWSNIRPTAGIIQQFIKQDSSVITVHDTPYDIHSIVHYHEDEFARKDTLKTITAVNGRSPLSNEHGLTNIDILKVNKLYSCGQLDNKIPEVQPVHTTGTGNIIFKSTKRWTADNCFNRASYDTGFEIVTTICVSVVSSGSYNWTQSEDQCQRDGGHLISITTDEENTRISLLIASNCWIGFVAISYPDRYWAWVDGANASYSHWNSGEPNNDNSDEYCAEMYGPESSSPNGNTLLSSWNDNSCNQTVDCFICGNAVNPNTIIIPSTATPTSAVN